MERKMRPQYIGSSEDTELNLMDTLPEYMHGSRHFLIEYLAPGERYFHGSVDECIGNLFLPDVSDVYERLDQICDIIHKAWDKYELEKGDKHREERQHAEDLIRFEGEGGPSE